MKYPILCSFALLALSCARPAAGVEISSGPVIVGDADQVIRKDDLEVYTKVTGLTTAQDTYEVYAPFDGRIEDVMAEPFTLVNPDTVMARMVSTEMAALLDSSSEESRKQTEKRWQGLYEYYSIKPQFQGIVSNIYAEPKAKVNKGDRLFTVARKVVIAGKNTEKLYSKLAAGMTADMVYVKDSEIKVKATLANFLPLKDSPYFNRLWLEVTGLRSGIKIGEQFDGYLLVGKSENTLLVPRTALLDKFGRRYLIMEVETGLSTEDQIEILKPGMHFISPRYPGAGKPVKERTDGKNKKTD